jgi:hypothetical protein
MHEALSEIELPASVVEALQEWRRPQEEADRKRLNAITALLLDQRKLNIDGRQSSGIEDVWCYCEEAYIGIDDANRHEFQANRWVKPLNPDGVLTRGVARRDNTKSVLYIPMTRRYTNAGVAKVNEILQDPDERPFGVKPTPVPDLADRSNDLRQVRLEDGTPAERDPTPKEVHPGSGGTPEHPLPLQEAPPTDTSQAPGKPLTYADLAQEKMKQAADASEHAAKRMHDWMVECNFTKHHRRVVQDGGRLGVGIVKGPFTEVSRTIVASKLETPDTMGSSQPATVVVVKEHLQPAAKHVSPWKFYPDPSCGENIQDGESVWEESDMGRSAVQKLAKLPGYSKRAIADILREDPLRILETTKDHEQLNKDQFGKLPYQVWFFYCTMKREDFDLVQHEMNEPISLEDALNDVYVQGTVINDRLVHLVPQPNEKTGAFPYHIFNWLHREGHWAGIGIPEQGMPAQRLINAAARREIDNAGYSAGMQLLLDLDSIEPVPVEGETNNFKLQSTKLWRKKAGAMITDLRMAMHAVQFPNAHAQLSWIIEFGIRLFEEITNIPLVTQGWSGKTTPETLGATELQNSNANQMLRDVAANDDYGVIVPFVKQLYEWLMLDETVPIEEKGDLKIFARGSTVLVDRYIQRQVYERMLPRILQNHNVIGVNPAKAWEEAWRSYRLNPETIKYTASEKQELANQPPPEPKEVTVAKMNLEVMQQELTMRHEHAVAELNLRREIAQLDFQIALLGYANKKEISLDQAKKDLAETSMSLATQKEISMHTFAQEVAASKAEPYGKARTGQAFQR